jgi:hypothetical protein
VHTFCDKIVGRHQPDSAGIRSGARQTLDWDGWIGVSEPRPFKATVYHPGNWRKRSRLWHGHARRHGMHIFSTPLRGLAVTPARQVTSYGPAPVYGNWPTHSKIHFVFGGTPYTPVIRWTSGGTTAKNARRRTVIDAVGGKVPSSGVAIIGTEAPSCFRTSTSPRYIRRRSLPVGDSRVVTPRNHYHEFIDAVASGSRHAMFGQLRLRLAADRSRAAWHAGLSVSVNER